jgi:2-desacetyl-2-hydroxyethyl bacteriochlorophyllide A dehydrogenase
MRSCGVCAYCRAGRNHLCGATAGRSLGYGVPGGFAERVLLRDVHPGVDVIAVPDDVAPEDLVWAEPVAVAVHAVGLLDAAGRSPVLVTGAGSVGLCATAVLLASGMRVSVVEPREDRRRAAALLGADVFGSVEAAAGTGPFSRVLDTSGSASAVADGLSVCRPGGLVVLVGLGSSPLPVPTRGVALRGSFAYTAADFGEAVALIAEGSVRLGRFVTHRYPLAGAGAAIDASANDHDVVKAVVVPASREDSP